jgi:hypothetical protein
MEKLLVPDPMKLSAEEKETALILFERAESYDFPSILEQLKNNFKIRQTIDKFWLKVLGYEGDYDDLLTNLYHSLEHEIKIIGELMTANKTKTL